MKRVCMVRAFLVLMIMMVLCGCGKKTVEEEASSSSGDFFLNLDYAGEAEWQDNTLDAYSAKYMIPMKALVDELAPIPEGYMMYSQLRIERMIMEDKAVIIRDYFLDEDKSVCMNKVITIDKDGNTTTGRADLSAVSEKWNTIGLTAQIWGGNHFFGQKFEDQKSHYFEIDENLKADRVLCFDFIDESSRDYGYNLVKDRDGLLHALYCQNVGGVNWRLVYTHYLISAEGELLATYPLETEKDGEEVERYSMRLSKDGRVVFKRKIRNTNGSIDEEAFCRNLETGEEEFLYERKSIPQSQSDGVFIEILSDDQEIIYASLAGVYKCDLEWKNKEPLYLWSNHGISPRYVENLYLRQDGEIVVVVSDDEEKYLIALTPTTEQREIKQITFAVAEYREEYYQPIVALFNQKYPAYHIELKTDYDETRLLTELVSGDGPVLVDSRLTGFEKQEGLWEPLDGMLAATGVKDELVDKVLEIGKINGVTYGIVPDFTVHSVLVIDQEITPSQWNYDSFLELLDKNKGKQTSPGRLMGTTGISGFLFDYLTHGTEDGYFLDLNAKKDFVDKKKLGRALKLAEECCTKSEWISDWKDAFRNGEILCYGRPVVGVGTITYDREEYGDQIQYLGYPTKEGAKNFVYGVYPLCIRKTASDEDKKIAYTLMLMMMSHDGQRAIMKRNISFGISIRKDVFEEQIQWVNELTLEQAKWEGSEGREKLKAQLEADAEYYRTIVNGASVIKSLPAEVEAILDEELSEYTSGNISRDQFIDHLQNRIGLYVNENR